MQNRNTRLVILVIVGLLLFTLMGFMVVKFVVSEEGRAEDERVITDLNQKIDEMEASMVEIGVLFDDQGIQVEEADRLLREKSEQLSLMEKEIERLRREGNVSKTRIRQLELELENARNRLALQQKSVDFERVSQERDELQARMDSLAAGSESLQELEETKRKYQALLKDNIQLREELADLRPMKDAIGELRAENFSFINIKGNKRTRGLEFDAKGMDEIEVCFTLLKNSIIEPGIKTVYVMIQRPDGVVMTNWSGYSDRAKVDGFYKDFSAHSTVPYERTDKNVCIAFKQSAAQEFMPGRNVIRVFCEGKFIGDEVLILN